MLSALESSSDPLTLDVPGPILRHLAAFVGGESGTEVKTDFVRGIRLKLLRLAARWDNRITRGQ